MNYEILPNGNLKISCDQEDLDQLHDIRERRNGVDDGFTLVLDITNEEGNGRFKVVAPEHIGALTSAPIITDDWTIQDDGETYVFPEAKVWWFPDYAVRDPLGELIVEGHVIFQKAP